MGFPPVPGRASCFMILHIAELAVLVGDIKDDGGHDQLV